MWSENTNFLSEIVVLCRAVIFVISWSGDQAMVGVGLWLRAVGDGHDMQNMRGNKERTLKYLF